MSADTPSVVRRKGSWQSLMVVIVVLGALLATPAAIGSQDEAPVVESTTSQDLANAAPTPEPAPAPQAAPDPAPAQPTPAAPAPTADPPPTQAQPETQPQPKPQPVDPAPPLARTSEILPDTFDGTPCEDELDGAELSDACIDYGQNTLLAPCSGPNEAARSPERCQEIFLQLDDSDGLESCQDNPGSADCLIFFLNISVNNPCFGGGEDSQACQRYNETISSLREVCPDGGGGPSGCRDFRYIFENGGPCAFERLAFLADGCGAGGSVELSGPPASVIAALGGFVGGDDDDSDSTPASGPGGRRRGVLDPGARGDLGIRVAADTSNDAGDADGDEADDDSASNEPLATTGSATYLVAGFGAWLVLLGLALSVGLAYRRPTT
ncbi:MAG: hypothetical protein ACR2NA_07470 [Solirubrobacterales bacterium]